MEFSLSKIEEVNLEKFKQDIKNLYGKVGTLKYTFTPTGVGNAIEVYSVLAKISREITDYDKW